MPAKGLCLGVGGKWWKEFSLVVGLVLEHKEQEQMYCEQLCNALSLNKVIYILKNLSNYYDGYLAYLCIYIVCF